MMVGSRLAACLGEDEATADRAVAGVVAALARAVYVPEAQK